MPRDIVTTWFGAFLFDREQVVAAYPFPKDRPSLVARARLRREGHLIPEEEKLLSDHRAEKLRARDQRLVEAGVQPGGFDPPTLDPRSYGFEPAEHREIVLEIAESGLREAWDPSIHIQEAVRALADLEATRNLLGERLGSWVGRDALRSDNLETASSDRTAEDLPMEGELATAVGSPPAALAGARAAIADIYQSARRVREEIERALESELPQMAPNLTALLGPLLSARLIAQAGGLDRLARLPASTIQVLGAERAFFEHLRGRAPPPRHGLLFLHPDVQSAPRALRGKLARALAGKAAIAARLDRAGRPVREELRAAFRHRVEEVRALGPRGKRRPEPRQSSVKPLHGAAEDG